MSISVSEQFVHVPFIGYENIISVSDPAQGTNKFIVDYVPSAGGSAYFVPKNSTGDDGDLPSGGSVDSYTSKNPTGRASKMISYMELIGEGPNGENEEANFLVAVAIPSGMAPGAASPLLDKKYSLSNQPPAESFDYSKFLPLVCAKPCLSLFGGALAGSYSGYEPPTGRFPTVPTQEPFDGAGVAGVFMYIPPGFYSSFGQILSDALTLSGFADMTLIDQPQYGILLVSAQFDSDIGSGCLSIDFSHSPS